MPQTKKLIRELECVLMDSEKLHRAEELSRGLRDQRELDDTMAAKKAVWKKIAQELELKIKHFSIIVHSGKETRPIECREEMNWPLKTVDCYRLDTGELVDNRPMYEHELQQEFNLNPNARGASDAVVDPEQPDG